MARVDPTGYTFQPIQELDTDFGGCDRWFADVRFADSDELTGAIAWAYVTSHRSVEDAVDAAQDDVEYFEGINERSRRDGPAERIRERASSPGQVPLLVASCSADDVTCVLVMPGGQFVLDVVLGYSGNDLSTTEEDLMVAVADLFVTTQQ